jgi:SAM-dependent methyltransferase
MAATTVTAERYPTADRYTNGEYLRRNPQWHADESPWKAKYVLRMMARHNLVPETICDVGCGAGRVLELVHAGLHGACQCSGYEISPQAFALARKLSSDRLQFKLEDIRQVDARFDLLLLLDVIEHLEDYFTFLRELKGKATYKIFQIPLDLSMRTVLLGQLGRFRAAYGHLHYFTKELALQMLRDVGYEILDYEYTWQTNSFDYVWNAIKQNPRTLPRKLAGFAVRTIPGLPSRMLFAIQRDLAVRIMGQWRLLVLAR